MRAILFHGWATDSRVFAPLAATLRAGGVPEPETPELEVILSGRDCMSWGDSLACWIERNSSNGERFILGGWSMGALLALEAAARLQDRVAALTLFAGCARFIKDQDSPAGQDSRVVGLMRRRLKASSGEVLRNFFSGMFSPAESSLRDRFERELQPHYLAQDPEWLDTGLEYLLNADCRECRRGIAAPALLVHGGLDGIIRPELGVALESGLPNSEITVLPGAGHAIPLTETEKLGAMVQGFLRESGTLPEQI